GGENFVFENKKISPPPRLPVFPPQQPSSIPQRLSRVDVVLFDAGEDPIEVARGDFGAAVFAVAGHLDAQRGAARGADGVGARRAFASRTSNERPVLAVAARLLAAAGDDAAVAVGDRVVEA